MNLPDRITFRPGSLAGPMAEKLAATGEGPSEYVRRLIATDCGVKPPDMPVGNPTLAEQSAAGVAARWPKNRAAERQINRAASGGMFEFQADLFGDRQPRTLTWRERYNAVIASARWRRLRAKRLAKCDHSCQRCGWKKETWDKSRTLDLHHRTYDRLGEERDDDLELVCSLCHVQADRERAKEGRQRADKALYNAQFRGWASKVYGEDYGGDIDEDMRERFQEWQERKQQDQEW